MKEADKKLLALILSKLIDSNFKAQTVFEMLSYENCKDISSDLFEVIFNAVNDWNEDFWLGQD